MKPIRVLDRDARISGQELSVRWNQISGGQRKILLVEVEIPASAEGARIRLGDASFEAKDRATGLPQKAEAGTEVGFSADPALAAASVDREAKAAEVRAVGNEAVKQAIAARDAGRTKEAQAILRSNAASLKRASQDLGSGLLGEDAAMSEQAAAQVEDELRWKSERKSLRSKQHKITTQSKE